MSSPPRFRRPSPPPRSPPRHRARRTAAPNGIARSRTIDCANNWQPKAGTSADPRAKSSRSTSAIPSARCMLHSNFARARPVRPRHPSALGAARRIAAANQPELGPSAGMLEAHVARRCCWPIAALGSDRYNFARFHLKKFAFVRRRVVVAIRVGINGFGRIGRLVFRIMAARGEGIRSGGNQRSDRHQNAGHAAEVRQHAPPLQRHRAARRQRASS